MRARSRMTMADDGRRALRAELRAARGALAASDRVRAAEGLATRLSALPFMPRRGRVAGYWAMDGEIALHAWQLSLPTSLEYCLPMLHEDGVLRFAAWRAGGALRQNRFGIPEPEVPAARQLPADALDLVVMPLVGFDAAGTRLGMGGGWYDRSFAFRAGRASPPWLVGAGFAVQQVESLPRAAWDVPADAICTERDTFHRDGR